MKKRKSIAFEEKSSLIPTCLFYARQTGPELKNSLNLFLYKRPNPSAAEDLPILRNHYSP
jgi:hypothetical protein